MSYQETIIPASTSEYQVFPLSCCSSNYNTGDYDPEFADGKATHKEVEQVINALQVARQPFVKKIQLMAFLRYLADFIVIVAVATIFFVLLGYSRTNFVIGVCICGICGMIGNDLYKKRLKKIDQESKDLCNKIIDDQYKGAFEAKGLRWFLPIHFPLWVELQKIGGNQNTAQPIYIPPAMHQQPNANNMNA